jgi:hypothetical protein
MIRSMRAGCYVADGRQSGSPGRPLPPGGGGPFLLVSAANLEKWGEGDTLAKGTTTEGLEAARVSPSPFGPRPPRLGNRICELRLTSTQLNGRREDRIDDVGSLPLKGGGQEGVGSASTTLRRVATRTIHRNTRRVKAINAIGGSMRHRPPPVLPLSGGGTRRGGRVLFCDQGVRDEVDPDRLLRTQWESMQPPYFIGANAARRLLLCKWRR